MLTLIASLAMFSPAPDLQTRAAEILSAGMGSDYLGASFLAHQGDEELTYVARGWADVAQTRAILRSTVFQTMSMTKPIVCVAAMILVERGKLGLDKPVSDYIPSFAALRVVVDGQVKPVRSPTIRELMTHTSGINPDNPHGLSDEEKRLMTLGAYTDVIATEALAAVPGTRVRYSGTGLTVLGRVVEVAAGKDLETFLQDEVFVPLNMSETSFFFREAWRTRLAEPMFREDGRFERLNEDPTRPGAKLANPAGGLYATIDDLANFMSMVAGEGSFRGLRLLKPETMREMLRQQVPEGTPGQEGQTRWGLGFVLHVAPSPIAGTVGHEGAFGTSFWAHPATGRSGVLMTQHMGRPAKIRNELAQLLAGMGTTPVRGSAVNRELH